MTTSKVLLTVVLMILIYRAAAADERKPIELKRKT
jgi:hypothetical protein